MTWKGSWKFRSLGTHIQFQQLKKETLNTEPFYIYENFNLSCYTAPSDTYNTNIFWNCLMAAMKNRYHLLKYQIILLDDAILRYVDICERVLSWLIINFQRAVDTRWDQLIKKAKPNITPQIIWVKPIPKALTHKWYKYHKQDKRDISHTLDVVINRYRNHHVLNINSIMPNESAHSKHRGRPFRYCL